MIEFIRDADVVIGDTQYDNVEYPTRLGWGHTCADEAVELEMKAGVKHLPMISQYFMGSFVLPKNADHFNCGSRSTYR